MTSMYESLISAELLGMSESPSPTPSDSNSSNSDGVGRGLTARPEIVPAQVGEFDDAEIENEAPPESFLRLETTPLSSRSPDSQGQWGEILSPSKVITPLYGGHSNTGPTPGGPGISLLDASSLGDFSSPTVEEMKSEEEFRAPWNQYWDLLRLVAENIYGIGFQRRFWVGRLRYFSLNSL